MNIAKKIRELRKEKDWSQTDLGRKVGVHQRYVSSWETGANIPSAETLVKLSEVLEVSIDYLLLDNVPKEGISKIDDFELYQQFRQAATLPQKEKEAIKLLLSGLAFRQKVKTAEEETEEKQQPNVPKEVQSGSLRKIAGKR